MSGPAGPVTATAEAFRPAEGPLGDAARRRLLRGDTRRHAAFVRLPAPTRSPTP
jgi:hypothetical protein